MKWKTLLSIIAISTTVIAVHKIRSYMYWKAEEDAIPYEIDNGR
tara:strand:+ start:6814 stop:6945 length:132 start_codon:yes stop_codon:yes gene_type:complete